MSHTLLALRGDTLTVATGRQVEIRSLTGAATEHVELETDATWLIAAPGGDGFVVGGGSGLSAAVWWRGHGLRPLARAATTRDRFGCGFAGRAGGAIVVVAHDGRLIGRAADGAVVFDADLGRPRPFRPRGFVTLDGDRLGMLGEEPGDPFDQVVTVELAALARDPGAVHAAMAARSPVQDRAVRLALGPAAGGAAIVYRDPEQEEDADDAEDSDVATFKGFYLRELATGALGPRLAFAGRIASGASLCASRDWILVWSDGAILKIDRHSGMYDELRGRALAIDPDRARVARLDRDGHLELLDFG